MIEQWGSGSGTPVFSRLLSCNRRMNGPQPINLMRVRMSLFILNHETVSPVQGVYALIY